MRDYNSRLADLLAPLVEEAFAHGENDMRALEYALIGFASKVEASRDSMPCHPVWHCRNCRKDWTVTITIKEERERFDPSNCPACYNAAQTPEKRAKDGPSRWIDYRYVSDLCQCCYS